MQVNNYVSRHLLRDEYVIHTFRPSVGKAFMHIGFMKIIIGLYAFLFALFLLVVNYFPSLINIRFTNGIQDNPAFIISLFPALILGLYSFLLYPMRRFIELKHTHYFITNKRIFIYSDGFIKTYEKRRIFKSSDSEIDKYTAHIKFGRAPMITMQRDISDIGDMSTNNHFDGSNDLVFYRKREVYDNKSLKRKNDIEFETVTEIQLIKSMIFELQEIDQMYVYGEEHGQLYFL